MNINTLPTEILDNDIIWFGKQSWTGKDRNNFIFINNLN